MNVRAGTKVCADVARGTRTFFVWWADRLSTITWISWYGLIKGNDLAEKLHKFVATVTGCRLTVHLAGPDIQSGVQPGAAAHHNRASSD
jgi:hypothetical protein